jgi:hypothetical protein
MAQETFIICAQMAAREIENTLKDTVITTDDITIQLRESPAMFVE